MPFSNEGGPEAVVFSIGTRTNSSEGGELKASSISENKLARFFRSGIGRWERKRSDHQDLVEKAKAAYRGIDTNFPENKASKGVFGNPFGDTLKVGIPFATTQTTVAAVAANNPEWRVSPQIEEARDFAKLSSVILSNQSFVPGTTWQRAMERWTRQGETCGMMIGLARYDADLNAFEKRLASKERERADQPSLLEQQLNRAAEALVDSELDSQPQEVTPTDDTEFFHLAERLMPEEVSYEDYVADPDCRDLPKGPAWEGRYRRVMVHKARTNTRYKAGARAKLQPTRRMMETGATSRFFQDHSPIESANVTDSIDEDFDIVELVEIYWYDDPDFAGKGGSLITLALMGEEELLERRANPWGRRPYVVEDWASQIGETFTTPDICQWSDVWSCFSESLWRLLRALKKNPNHKILYNKNEITSNEDEISGLLYHDDGEFVGLDAGDNPLSANIQELRASNLSPEYLNTLNFCLTLIQIIEGFGPNQLAGGALKSETSATEAREIGSFSRARVGTKGKALSRLSSRMAGNLLAGLFRFFDDNEIVRLAGPELAAKVQDRPDMLDARFLDRIAIEIDPVSMAPDARQQQLASLQVALGLLQQLPQLQVQMDNDTWLNAINSITSLVDTGEEYFVGLDDPKATVNILQQQIAGQQRQGSAPRARGQSNNPGAPV